MSEESVFLLWYVREGDGDDGDLLIGVYRTEADAEAAINRLKSKAGFVAALEGFRINRYELNRDHWEDGYVTGTSGGVKFKNSPLLNVEGRFRSEVRNAFVTASPHFSDTRGRKRYCSSIFSKSANRNWCVPVSSSNSTVTTAPGSLSAATVPIHPP